MPLDWARANSSLRLYFNKSTEKQSCAAILAYLSEGKLFNSYFQDKQGQVRFVRNEFFFFFFLWILSICKCQQVNKHFQALVCEWFTGVYILMKSTQNEVYFYINWKVSFCYFYTKMYVVGTQWDQWCNVIPIMNKPCLNAKIILNWQINY